MATKIFVNLAVKDLDRAKAFWTALGYSFNPRFTDDKAACLVFSEDVYAMLLREEFFATFTKKAIIDAKTSVQTLLAIALEDRAAVESVAAKAVAAGGTVVREEDLGWMFTRAVEDPDGHIWEFFWMDPSQAPKA